MIALVDITPVPSLPDDPVGIAICCGLGLGLVGLPLGLVAYLVISGRRR